MAAEKDSGAEHEKALDKAEAALEAMVDGDSKKADKLIAESKKLDPSAVEEVASDLDEADPNFKGVSGKATK